MFLSVLIQDVYIFCLQSVFQVNDDSVVNMVTSDIMKMGPYTVTCTPLCEYDSGEKHSGYWNTYNGPKTQRILSGEHVVWFEVAYNHGNVNFLFTLCLSYYMFYV